MKVNTNSAWEGAVRLMRGNKDVLLVVAGVFFFLPTFVLGVLAPEIIDPMAGKEPETYEQMVAIVENLPASFWIANIILSLIQAAGVLALFRLLTDQQRPTVGQALGFGAKALPSYVGTQLLQLLAFVFAIGIPLSVLALAAGPAGALLAAVLAIPAFLFIFTRLSMASPIIGIEGELNPVTALTRSWTMVKGNTLRLFVFYLLLFVCLIVVTLVIGAVFGLIFALMGEQVQLLGNNLVSALLSALVATVFVTVLASIHRQLSGPASGTSPSVPPTA